ncbi:MAG: hypothetical protein OXC29_01045 [Rhodococcus sp.]|nr:hypothetical protein [Rhodococcus sp. (in: high G+C Gram-positive bacteria)]
MCEHDGWVTRKRTGELGADKNGLGALRAGYRCGTGKLAPKSRNQVLGTAGGCVRVEPAAVQAAIDTALPRRAL